MSSLTVHSPAKINLMLSVHGPREDGFHALTSVVAALEFGDRLDFALGASGRDRLESAHPGIPLGPDNLILRAADCFRKKTGLDCVFDCHLEKRIPMGAGLGGGSSNAAQSLLAMNKLTGCPLTQDELLELAAELGSDCPFFIGGGASLMTGRGAELSRLPTEMAEHLRGQRILLFKPDFSIATAAAYARLREDAPASYETEQDALKRLEVYRSSGRLSDLLFNSFERSVGQKYLAITCLLEQLREAGHSCLLSGSGSCCFAAYREPETAEAIRGICERAWGAEIFVIETSLV
jgi:4-diphosphocytidyl-2-C-methyl-D-erythritol kinase